MAGYRNNPAATAETVDVDGWLHTGDLARIDADGHLFIVGRVKELIKYNGFQVAPAELEAVLLEHPTWPAPPSSACPTSKSARSRRRSSSPGPGTV